MMCERMYCITVRTAFPMHPDCIAVGWSVLMELSIYLPQNLWTPLHNAAYNGHVEVVEVLLAEGADLGARDEVRRMEGDGRGKQGQFRMVDMGGGIDKLLFFYELLKLINYGYS